MTTEKYPSSSQAAVAARAQAFAGALVADDEPEHTQLTEPDPYDVEITINAAAVPARTKTPAPLPALPLPPDAQAFADRLRPVLWEQCGLEPMIVDIVIAETRFLMGKPLPPRSR